MEEKLEADARSIYVGNVSKFQLYRKVSNTRRTLVDN